MIRALDGSDAEGLAGISRFLLRSEAIANSRIEGIASSPQQVALAELGQSESVRGVSEQARLVANNMTVVRRSTTELVEADLLTVEGIVDLHASLLPEQPQLHGLRTVQNWIGGSDWNPIRSDFVPPAPERVPELMADLVDYLNGAAHAPLVQAAVVHAQFETIGAYRHQAAAGTPDASVADNEWLVMFVEASAIAVEQSSLLRDRVNELGIAWADRLSADRRAAGVRATPRADSAVARLLGQLSEAPVVTATTLTRILDVSFPAATAALEELRQAGILHTKAIERGATAYIAREVLDLIAVAERALASRLSGRRRS